MLWRCICRISSEDQNDPAKATRFAKVFHHWLLATLESPCHAVEAKKGNHSPEDRKRKGVGESTSFDEKYVTSEVSEQISHSGICCVILRSETLLHLAQSTTSR